MEEKEEGIRKECISLLRKVGCDEHVVRHCIVVANFAFEISKRKDGVSKKLIFTGALLHDIGRARSHGIDHGFSGGEIARSFGHDEKVVRIIQRHVGAGITAKEAKELGLPSINFVPETMEEKIVAHADNLIDSRRRRGIEEVIKDMKDKLGERHLSIERMKRLHEEVMENTPPQQNTVVQLLHT